jgi:hypothetical protein
MLDAKQLLVAIDEFDLSQPLISYVSALTAASEQFHVHLFHAADPLPPDPLALKILKSKSESNKTRSARRIGG